jgi:hypothetical protein
MAFTVPKFGPILCKGADGTTGASAGSPAAAKHQKTVGEYKLSINFGAMLHCNSTHKKGNGPIVADVALAPFNVKRAVDATKMVDLILSDDNDGLTNLKTTPAAKPAAKPIVMLPPYKGKDLDIDRLDGLNELDGLDKLQGSSTQQA